MFVVIDLGNHIMIEGAPCKVMPFQLYTTRTYVGRSYCKVEDEGYDLYNEVDCGRQNLYHEWS